MISVVALWNQVQQTAKTGTTGYQTQDEFNRDLATAQTRICNVLCDNYDISNKVEDALFGLIVSQETVTSSFGIVSTPSDYFRLITMWVNINGVYYLSQKIALNQVPVYITSFVRKPDLSKNRTVYYYLDGAIQMLPLIAIQSKILYCKVPPTASIILTPESSWNYDYIVPTAGTDLVWSPLLFNLFQYTMLEMLGIECKDQIIYEYSQLGIPKEAYVSSTLTGGQA
jgi:hypothetical protein